MNSLWKTILCVVFVQLVEWTIQAKSHSISESLLFVGAVITLRLITDWKNND